MTFTVWTLIELGVDTLSLFPLWTPPRGFWQNAPSESELSDMQWCVLESSCSRRRVEMSAVFVQADACKAKQTNGTRYRGKKNNDKDGIPYEINFENSCDFRVECMKCCNYVVCVCYMRLPQCDSEQDGWRLCKNRGRSNFFFLISHTSRNVSTKSFSRVFTDSLAGELFARVRKQQRTQTNGTRYIGNVRRGARNPCPRWANLLEQFYHLQQALVLRQTCTHRFLRHLIFPERDVNEVLFVRWSSRQPDVSEEGGKNEHKKRRRIGRRKS